MRKVGGGDVSSSAAWEAGGRKLRASRSIRAVVQGCQDAVATRNFGRRKERVDEEEKSLRKVWI